MRISVVVPAYNEEKYITRCLVSLTSQEIMPDEIIVVDNNCTDHTIDIAEKFNVRIVREKKQGMTYARNAGFDNAKFEIIARTDADTQPPNDWILRIKKGFEDKNLGALSGPAYYYRFPPMKELSLLINSFFFKKINKMLKHDALFGPNMSIRKSAWEKVRNTVCLDNRMVHEDIDLSIHLGKHTILRFDTSLAVYTSPRRWAGLSPEYAHRLLKTLRFHKKFL